MFVTQAVARTDNNSLRFIDFLTGYLNTCNRHNSLYFAVFPYSEQDVSERVVILVSWFCEEKKKTLYNIPLLITKKCICKLIMNIYIYISRQNKWISDTVKLLKLCVFGWKLLENYKIYEKDIHKILVTSWWCMMDIWCFLVNFEWYKFAFKIKNKNSS